MYLHLSKLLVIAFWYCSKEFVKAIVASILIGGEATFVLSTLKSDGSDPYIIHFYSLTSF